MKQCSECEGRKFFIENENNGDANYRFICTKCGNIAYI